MAAETQPVYRYSRWYEIEWNVEQKKPVPDSGFGGSSVLPTAGFGMFPRLYVLMATRRLLTRRIKSRAESNGGGIGIMWSHGLNRGPYSRYAPTVYSGFRA